ncbi:heme o synthase [Robertmurraya andreesenii]|uniref:Protoheme IX farnesyltransferase n=1 Tax=Anoxybacillus andreesenii TaxID=1325932 RepID=A0ABT9V8W2_9BACL|nr:heme o synthase [Robertmurraya andreesenii]MDQ0157404.1 protoheme IX farnesyltransferase [Robertmurraya andreesenii]
MSNDMILSQQKVEKVPRLTIMNLLSDLKSLFKAIVLIANVLPVFTGLWLALYFADTSFWDKWEVSLLTLGGSTLVMAGALVLNNWYDVDIDSVMERTKSRPTVTGRIPLHVVLAIGIILTILGFVLLLFTTLEATVYAFIGWVTYVFLYTMWSKRRYAFNTIIGSVSGAVTPLIGWAAIDSAFHTVPIILFLILFIWQMPHTFAIAIKKFDEYKAAGVAVLPVVRGLGPTKWQNIFYIICLLPLPFYLASLGTIFIIFSTCLNVAWLVLAVSGFFMKDDWKWAHMNFLYSVNYVTILFSLMVILTLF